MFATLRGCSVDQSALEAIKTLETLIKVWARYQEHDAVNLMRTQKIAWGEVLKKGAPHEAKKVKGQTITRLVSPPKPSKSPWCSTKERQKISNLFSTLWSKPDSIRDEWVRLKPERQHLEFDAYVTKLRNVYIEMNATSQAVMARLGHRKQWILSAVKAADKEPIGKEKKKDPFVWSTLFYKQDLTQLRETVKMIFCPTHYLESRWNVDELLTQIYSNIHEGKDALGIGVIQNSELRELFKHWLDRFQPDLKIKVSAPLPSEVEDTNPFSILDQATA